MSQRFSTAALAQLSRISARAMSDTWTMHQQLFHVCSQGGGHQHALVAVCQMPLNVLSGEGQIRALQSGPLQVKKAPDRLGPAAA